MNNQKLSGGSLPLSPQLWSSVRHKHPRISMPSSRKLSPAPPSTSALESTTDSFTSISSGWCVDNMVSNGPSYLSRDKLLSKMYLRRVHYRCFLPKNEADKLKVLYLITQDIRILGIPIDYWFTFPLKNTQQEVESPDKKATLARYWGVKSSREMLNRDIGFGKLPTVDRLTFPWVTNASATKFRSLKELVMIAGTKSRIEGLVECIKCGEIIGIGYLWPGRVQLIMKHILEKFVDFDNDCEIECNCDGIATSRLPIISENYRKINWMFLFCGFGLGYCTEEQLRYFCNQRTLPSSGGKDDLLCNICEDFGMQIDP